MSSFFKKAEKIVKAVSLLDCAECPVEKCGREGIYLSRRYPDGISLNRCFMHINTYYREVAPGRLKRSRQLEPARKKPGKAEPCKKEGSGE